MGLQIDKVGPYAPRPGFEAANLGRSSRRCGPSTALPTTRSPCSSSRTPSQRRWTRPLGPVTARAPLPATAPALASALTEGANRALGRDLRASSSSAHGRDRRASPGSSPTSTTASRSWPPRHQDHRRRAPIGFVSDHMEVVHDLDTEATETADPWACRSCGCHRRHRPALRRRSRRRPHGAGGRGRGEVARASTTRAGRAVGVRAGLLPQPPSVAAGPLRRRLRWRRHPRTSPRPTGVEPRPREAACTDRRHGQAAHPRRASRPASASPTRSRPTPTRDGDGPRSEELLHRLSSRHDPTTASSARRRPT